MGFLHIANGHSTTTLISQAGIAGTLSIWADVLHEGPVPGGISDTQLRAVRARHLAGAGSGEDYDETLAALQAWDSAIDHTHAAGPEISGNDAEVVLWYEHDLFDQLNLIQLLDRLGRRPAPAAAVSLICVGAFPGHPTFKGLGELSPGELASLWQTRRPVEEVHYVLARRAWEAFRGPGPERLEGLLAEDLSALPFLGRALRRHLEEFPSIEHGLSRTERRLLEIVGGSSVDVSEAFHRMHEGESCFYIADASVWRVAQELARLDPPLISIDLRHVRDEGPRGDDGNQSVRPAGALPRGGLALTSAGRGLLRGAIDRVRDFGIDRWMGGVHLSGRGPTWRWDHETRRVVWQ